ncbi:hypothetical protein BJV74DRAFT_847579 [Russula compacta]|nr:hypothetical protein BJV74DRAFT_847579 [Russula compacta]
MDSSSPCVSFIGIVDFSEHARWVYMTESVTDLLGYEPHELLKTSSLDLVHPDEYRDVKNLHYTTISQDKAAVLAYLRLKHKDPYKGYILCAISRTVAWNVLVGSVSFASMGPKAMHNASTAQEVTIITPSAANFEFRRWGDPSPMPPSPIQGPDSPGSPSETDSAPDDSASESSGGNPATSNELSSNNNNARPIGNGGGGEGGSRTGPDGVITFDPLPRQSIRTALILNRFSTFCPINYCSNNSFLSTTEILGRPFFDFVARRDEALVRSWIDAVKGWGVNERGQPSDGGFGFGKFHLYPRGRDSVERMESEPSQSQPRNGGRTGPRSGSGSSNSRSSVAMSQHHHTSRAPVPHTAAPEPLRPRHPRSRAGNTAEAEIVVDAIFSAHSDGLMVILRHASPPSVAGGAPHQPQPAVGPSTLGPSSSSSLSQPTST